jgi:hypothetical protein
MVRCVRCSSLSVSELTKLFSDVPDWRVVLAIVGCSEGTVEVSAVSWVPCAGFCVPSTLGTFSVLDPPDSSVLLVFILRSVCCALVDGDVRE